MAIDIIIPSVGESITTGVISRWLKNNGEAVNRDEPVLELETDKITLEVPAPAAGVLQQTAKAGDTVSIGASVGSIDSKAAVGAAAAVASKPALSTPISAQLPGKSNATAPPAEDIRATPLARKTAEHLRVDMSKLHGTGPGGRVREADVLGAAKPAEPVRAAANGHSAPAQPAGSRPVDSSRERMSPMRQRIAQRLVQAQHHAAMLTTFNECDMSAVMDLRKQFKEDFEKKHGVGLGFMSFFVKAAAGALRAFPLVNASIADEGGQLYVEKHESADIAVAVSTPKGLVVPVVRGCEDLSFAQVESKIKDLATRARDGKLTLEEMQGGTFTITNGGIFGSLMSTPILNPPQSAILGMHAIKNRAVEHPIGSQQAAIRPMMYLAVSYDHRIIDGAEAVQFLVHIKKALEDPQRLLLGL